MAALFAALSVAAAVVSIFAWWRTARLLRRIQAAAGVRSAP